MSHERSSELFGMAQGLMPGGVSSPVRAFKAVGGNPPVIAYGEGPLLFDVDGKQYVDYVCGYGPMILGHAHPAVANVIAGAAHRGTAYGATSELEIVLARMITEAVPSIDMVRFVNSGTEATMSALRLARGFTGRSKVLKFEGCYHGHADGLLVAGGSGLATLSIPDCPGVPQSYAAETLVAPYNDLDSVAAQFEAHGSELAAVIVEPIAGNMGVVLPADGFLSALRDLCTRHGALLVFDEVISGFRMHFGAVQTLLGVTPDLTCLGKIIGGGLPVGAYGGRRDVMEQVAPLGPVYQAGTLSGNPLAMAAGIATFEVLQDPLLYTRLEVSVIYLEDGIRRAAEEYEVPLRINRAGSLLTPFFTTEPVTDYASAKRANTARYAEWFREMLNRGVFLAPSQFEAMFLSSVHTDAEIEATIEAARQAFRAIT